MGLKIPEPISATKWREGYYRGSNFHRIDGFLMDEVDGVLANIFGKPIYKATYTLEKMEGLNNMTNTTTTNDLNNSIILGNGWHIKNDKLCLDDRWSNATISNAYYTVKGLTDMNEWISDINVIVPDKVVEITFVNGKTEKMVCHEDDTFDLRKCCFIAIAKHLYKKEYTQEGIEYIATQLTYQKKYVKIVDKALKNYKRKVADKEKAERNEAEEKEIRERQLERRRKQKERRAQKHRDVIVNLIADAIHEANKGTR